MSQDTNSLRPNRASASVLILIGTLIFPFVFSGFTAESRPVEPVPISIHAARFYVTRPVRELAAARARITGYAMKDESPRGSLPPVIHAQAVNDPPLVDPLLKPASYVGTMPPPIVTFDGLAGPENRNVFNLAYEPPDSNGDIGPNHYVEVVNTLYQVFDRTGKPLIPPAKFSTLFAELGEPAAKYDDGDPVVRYDHLADRWVITLFVVSDWFDSNGPSRQVIAVSKTGDPTGEFFVYDFPMPNDNLNDYPKLGIWPDAYYLSINQFSHDYKFAGAGVFAYERDKLLAGDASAAAIFFDLKSATNRPASLLPSDLDGPPPPAGTRNVFACLISNQVNAEQLAVEGFEGDAGEDETPPASSGHLPYAVRLFEFKADFQNQSRSAFVEQKAVLISPFRIFDGDADTIVQRGATNGLDSLSERLMYRLQFRHFADHDSLVVNHTVKANTGGTAGVRYYELRRFPPAGPFFLHDEGTFAPDATSRWMASAALDWQGNLAIGYSAAGRDTFPSIRYAGRAGDNATGGLNMAEATLQAGSAPQDVGFRWGDYTMLAVDPLDEATFWYVNQYATNFGAFGLWRTRIGSFRFPGAVPAPKGSFQVAVVDADTHAPVLDAIIRLGNGYWRRGDSTNSIEFRLAPAHYTFSATAPGYEPSETATATLVAGTNVSSQIFMKRVKFVIDVATEGALEFSGPWHGPFEPESTTLSLTNVGTEPVRWAAYWNNSWLIVVPADGILAAGAATNLSIRVDPVATNLPAGDYEDTISLLNATAGSVIARTARLTIQRDPGTLTLSSNYYAAISGAADIFIPINRTGGADGIVQVEVVTSGLSALDGVDFISQKRTIVFGNGETSKVVAIPLLAGNAPSSRSFHIRLQNPGGGAELGGVSEADVTIVRTNGSVFREFLSSDPNWQKEGMWEYGIPKTDTDASASHADPLSGYTGRNVYGYNLSGDYANNLPNAFYLTSPELDCSRFEKVTLYFARWLSVERSLSDHAAVEVSNDGMNWTTVWSNAADVSMHPKAWEKVSYDLSAVADRRSKVYVRWGMGPTDNSVTAGGWNLDDIEVFGTPVVPIEITGRLDRVQTSFVLSWASTSNQVFSVDFTRSLSDSFQTMTENLKATPPLNSVTNAILSADRAGFYRVRLQ